MQFFFIAGTKGGNKKVRKKRPFYGHRGFPVTVPKIQINLRKMRKVSHALRRALMKAAAIPSKI
jgi:hypothetical protein